MNKTASIIAAIGAITFFGTANAADPARGFRVNGNADRCFEETLKAQNGGDPGQLSTALCQRALRFEPQGREDQSAILHNRGLIEQAQGDLVAARASFGRAVSLSQKVDMRNVALAQAAHKLGEYDVAVEQYDLVISSGFSAPSTPQLQAIVVRNRDRALQAFLTARLATDR